MTRRRLIKVLIAVTLATGVSLLLYTAYLVWDPGAAERQHQLASQLENSWREPLRHHQVRPHVAFNGHRRRELLERDPPHIGEAQLLRLQKRLLEFKFVLENFSQDIIGGTVYDSFNRV